MHQTINYGGYDFSYPEVWGGAFPPSIAGLYAVQVFDANCTPQPYRLVYVGQTDDLERRMAEHWRDDLPSWTGAGTLYLSVLYAPASTVDQRCAAETGIIRKYAPTFNQIASRR